MDKKSTISVKHLANSGDVVSVMAGLRQVSKALGKKIIFYQWLNVEAQYYSGASHPILNDSGKMVCMNKSIE